jgi:hypothetical protein
LFYWYWWNIWLSLFISLLFISINKKNSCAIIAYHHLSCEFEPHSWRGVLDKTLCDKACQWFATDLDFSGYSNFPHKSSDWNIFESGVKHLTSNGQIFVGLCISWEVPSIADTTLGILEQYLFFCHQTGMVGHWILRLHTFYKSTHVELSAVRMTKIETPKLLLLLQ